MSKNAIADTLDLFSKCMFDTMSLFVKADRRKYNWEYFFNSVGLVDKDKKVPIYHDLIKEEYYNNYIFRVSPAFTVNDFNKKIDHIAYFMNTKIENIRLEQKSNKVHLRVRNNNPMNFDYDVEKHKRKDFKIPLGYDFNNKLVLWDIASNSNCHCYVAGSSGGGKSITLRLILSHLVNSKSKRDIEFSIINTKRVDLKDFEHCKHTVNYMSGIEGVEDFLEVETDEMERRYKLLEKYDCDDLAEFRKKEYKIPYRLIIVEEISSYKGNKEYQRAIEFIASQGRGAGILLLLVTQLPSYEIMPNTIKCNINTTIGLKTKDSIRSEIIAGEDADLHKLKGNGHSKLFDGDHQGTEYQGLYIDKDTMKAIIKANSKQNKRAIEAGTSITPGDNNIPG